MQSYDVVVVGAGIAGCTAAILYARDGHKVALVEREKDAHKYKKFCTHFIQGGATPTMRRLGIDTVIEAAGALRNTVDIWTKCGWIIEPAMRDEHGDPLFGYSIRREVLDPALRTMAGATAGLTYLAGHGVAAITNVNGQVAAVTLNDPDKTMLKAKLVVAADGRNSRLAALAEVPTRLSENRRGGVFAHYRHVATGRGERSLMWITPRGVGYVFQNDDNVCVVTAMPDKDDWASFDADPEEALLSFLAKQCDPADFSKAERVSEFIKVKDYPNQSRAPVYAGMALIGDAALSADPLFGVGCGWAFATAEQLVNATSAALAEPAALARGLKAYARYHRWFLGGHRLVIEDFSKRRDINTFERLVYRAAARDRRFAEHFYRFGMRIDSLAAFMSPWPMLRMLWLNLTAGRPGKTSPVPSQPA